MPSDPACRSRLLCLAPLVPLVLAVTSACGSEPPPTFHGDIASIVHTSCAGCHRPGQPGPFDLLTYDDVRRHARQVAEVTASGSMPPWLPLDGEHAFRNSRRLSGEQIARIGRWVSEGSVEGDPATAQPLPTWTEGWQLGQPDLVVQLPEEYTLAASGADVYRNFVIRSPVTASRYVRALEFRPGNQRIVHHAFVLVDDSAGSRRADSADPSPGFDGIHPPESATSPASAFLSWTPGRRADPGVRGRSWALHKGTDLVIQLHLQPSGKTETVRASVGLYFDDEPPTELAYKIGLFSKQLDIPAGERAYTVERAYTLPVAVDVLAVLPHTHFLGRSMVVHARPPGGGEQTLLEIPAWDFNWQEAYTYAEPVALPQGTKLSMRFVYDNSADNVANPFSPPRRVTYGLQSTDEMCELWLLVAPHSPAELLRLREDYQPILMRQALADARRALDVDPNDTGAQVRIGQSELALGRTAQALAAFNAALAIDADCVEAHQFSALVHESRGHKTAALKALQRAVFLRPTDHRLRFELGSLHYRLDDLDKAGASYQEAYYLDPEHFRTNLQLGVVLARLGRPDLAIRHFETAARLRPDDPDARQNLARAQQLVNAGRR